jgi:hypothetical protein
MQAAAVVTNALIHEHSNGLNALSMRKNTTLSCSSPPRYKLIDSAVSWCACYAKLASIA